MNKRYKVKRFSSCYLMNWVDNKTNKELTALEIEEILHKQEKRIAELEAKLADSEEEHELLIDQFEEETEKLRKQIKQESDARKRLVEEVKNLRQQLTESKKQCQECKHLNKKIELNIKNKLMAENCELQKRLAEKEKEIAYLTKQVRKFNNEAQKYFEDAYCNDFHNQDKISFAIAELEKVKDYAQHIQSGLINYIENQIKSLKGEE